MEKLKKWARITGIVLAVLLLVLIVAGIALPGERTATASERIEATPLELHPYLSDLRQWPNWTAWNTAEDPTCQWEYSGPIAQVGFTMQWQGEELGEGRVVLTQFQQGRSVTYDYYPEGSDDPSEGRFEMRVVGNATEITWTQHLDLGWFPLTRLVGPVLQMMMEGDLEDGLERLKAKAEA